MKIIHIKTTAFIGLILLSGTMRPMKHGKSQDSFPKEHIDKFITDVIIKGRAPERVIISPYVSTGMTASIKATVEEAPSVVLNGLRDYALRAEDKGQITYKLQNPILINPTTKNPELYIGVIRENGKVAEDEVFSESKINKLNKSNTLIIDENSGIYTINISQ